MAHTIVLSGQPIYPPEAIASEAITPGHLIEFVLSGGDTGQLKRHATASGNAAAFIACESLVPDFANATEGIDKAYADGDSVRWCVGQPGGTYYMWVPASASAIVRGDLLTSNGDGTLKKYAGQASNEGGSATYTIQVAAAKFMADEAKDNSSGSTAVRIRVRAI